MTMLASQLLGIKGSEEMSSIDFDNGFICGMATKGLTRSGQFYRPNIWNDIGIYSYFYIDFKLPIETFSVGMLKESLIIYDSEEIELLNFEKVSGSVYKVFCNISDKTKGVTVINKKSSLLVFANKSFVPAFSVMFYVAGLASIIRKAYAYETAALLIPSRRGTLEAPIVYYQDYLDTSVREGAAIIVDDSLTTSETPDISYWGV